MTLVPLPAMIVGVLRPVRPAPLERLPGSAEDDPFLRLAAAWLVGYGVNTFAAYLELLVCRSMIRHRVRSDSEGLAVPQAGHLSSTRSPRVATTQTPNLVEALAGRSRSPDNPPTIAQR